MNHLIFNEVASELKSSIYGSGPSNEIVPIKTDASGILQVGGTVDATINSALTISGGTIDIINSNLTIGGGTIDAINSALTISGGTIDIINSNLTIGGGTIDAINSALTISGGTIDAINSAITISGGTIDAINSAITISGGTITLGSNFYYTEMTTLTVNSLTAGSVDFATFTVGDKKLISYFLYSDLGAGETITSELRISPTTAEFYLPDTPAGSLTLTDTINGGSLEQSIYSAYSRIYINYAGENAANVTATLFINAQV